ncbi:asparagine synthase (glutamine-hydrolyzing) [Acidobacteria bacterium AB60]|nr:asparagine synthase (glutamine-hydrolyzing) [Acidobacteria bacterium AB60]
MCGLAGILNFGGEPVDPEVLGDMVAMLRHRGPDERGLVIRNSVGFGHARLSIIDIAGGRQPMQSHNNELMITFNGEIFNYLELREDLARAGHRFRTRSDTEVILHLYQRYGEHCVDYLNGQWSFAIWDKRNRKLFASRDRLGVRPFFYACTRDALVFGSEIKAIFAHPGIVHDLDPHGLEQIFTFWATLPPSTPFRGVYELPPGHSLVLQGGQLTVRRYWRLQFEPASGVSSDPEHLVEELLELLTDATRIRLRADVPVGAYLSGGLDSTLTTSLIRRVHSGPLKTFSVGFEDRDYDESAFQREASTFLETEHDSVRCTYDDIADVFPRVIWHTEMPILRTAPAPLFLLSRLVREDGFKVVVTGEGSDELFGGYDIYKEAKIRRFWAKQPASTLRPRLLGRLYPYMQDIQKQSPAYLAAFFHVRPGDLEDPFFSHLPRWELTSRLKMFFSDEIKTELHGYDPLEELRAQLPPDFGRMDPFCQSQFLETAYLLPGYILSSQGDRMAMAHAVEGRYPFLDHRVVSFAATIPATLKMKALNEKHILKRAARGLVPDSIIARHKQPYRAPDGRSFFNGKHREYVQDTLSSSSVRDAGLFKPDAVNGLLSKFAAGHANGTKDNMALVGILSTALIMDQFILNFRRSPHLCSHEFTNCAAS